MALDKVRDGLFDRTRSRGGVRISPRRDGDRLRRSGVI
jgi:hypothetical protein